jgi:hypothetical protein
MTVGAHRYRFQRQADALGVETSAGYIRHHRFRGIQLPVKVATLTTRAGNQVVLGPNGLVQPVRRGPMLVFALPGGGEVEVPRP